tara:strand:- start:1491 stop:1961 length:471 start_codon:yes stop_codon:yes gene_type:complete
MALTAKETGTIHSMTGSDKDELKALYDEGHLNTLSEMKDSHPELAALAYQIQNISNDIDALRQFSGTEEKGRIDANATNITVNNGKISTNIADIATNRNNIPRLTVTIAVGVSLDVQVRLMPPQKGQKKGTAVLIWTVTDITGKAPVTYTGTQILT